MRMNELEAVAQIVNAIHQRCVELGWTQKELADKAGFHQESIARKENDGTIPRLTLLYDHSNNLCQMAVCATTFV